MGMVDKFVPKGKRREIPDLSNASLAMLPKLVREVKEGLAALHEGMEQKDMEQIDDWCHRLAGTWGMIYADKPLDELHELLKHPESVDEQSLRLVIDKVEAMGDVIIRQAQERIKELENE